VTPLQTELDPGNRWVKLSECISWDNLAEGLNEDLSSNQGRPAKDAQMIIGAVINKHLALTY
jgi:transposase, IS5 family